MTVILYSAPNENYLDHLSKCEEKFNILFPVFCSTIRRVLFLEINEDLLRDSFLKMILYHDLGKLTGIWQARVGSGKSLPSHSTLGAAYLWQILPEGLKEPLSFAIAIHHSDRGLMGDNIERPDVQAILDKIVKNDGTIEWDDNAYKLDDDFFPQGARIMNINDLKKWREG